MSTQELLSGKSIADLRKDYAQAALEESSAHADPFKQFEQWFQWTAHTISSQIHCPRKNSACC